MDTVIFMHMNVDMIMDMHTNMGMDADVESRQRMGVHGVLVVKDAK
jgi:hypothetical protein